MVWKNNFDVSPIEEPTEEDLLQKAEVQEGSYEDAESLDSNEIYNPLDVIDQFPVQPVNVEEVESVPESDKVLVSSASLSFLDAESLDPDEMGELGILASELESNAVSLVQTETGEVWAIKSSEDITNHEQINSEIEQVSKEMEVEIQSLSLSFEKNQKLLDAAVEAGDMSTVERIVASQEAIKEELGNIKVSLGEMIENHWGKGASIAVIAAMESVGVISVAGVAEAVGIAAFLTAYTVISIASIAVMAAAATVAVTAVPLYLFYQHTLKTGEAGGGVVEEESEGAPQIIGEIIGETKDYVVDKAVDYIKNAKV